MNKKKLVLINTLPRESYDDCRIRGSVHIPFEKLEEFVKSVKHEKDQLELIVYGSSYQCKFARDAWKFLNNLGFDVKLYEAGMREWSQKGLPTEGLCKATYLRELDVVRNHPHQNSIVKISTDELRAKIDGA